MTQKEGRQDRDALYSNTHHTSIPSPSKSMTQALYITGYGSTLYYRIAMVFVFSPYIWKFTSCFQFQVNLTFNDFTAQNMSKVICVPNISLNYHFLAKLLKKLFWAFCPWCSFLLLRNPITIVPLHTKLGICTGFGRS